MVPLQRTGPNNSLRFNASSAGWINPSVQSGSSVTIPSIHNITADQATGLICLCSNGPATLLVLTVNSPGSYSAPVILYQYYSAGTETPHCAYIKDSRVFASLFVGAAFPDMGNAVLGCVDEFLLSSFTPGLPVQQGLQGRRGASAGGHRLGSTQAA